jgi:hypothetical protein
MTALSFPDARVAVRRRPAGWVARLPGGIVAALRVTLIYGEAARVGPPPA